MAPGKSKKQDGALKTAFGRAFDLGTVKDCVLHPGMAVIAAAWMAGNACRRLMGQENKY